MDLAPQMRWRFSILVAAAILFNKSGNPEIRTGHLSYSDNDDQVPFIQQSKTSEKSDVNKFTNFKNETVNRTLDLDILANLYTVHNVIRDNIVSNSPPYRERQNSHTIQKRTLYHGPPWRLRPPPPRQYRPPPQLQQQGKESNM